MKERVAASLPVDCVVVIAMLLLSLSLCVAPPPASEATLVPVELADATDAERGALEKLRQGEFWPSRALGLMRLERFDCPESALLLTGYFEDKAWQVRSYAFAIAARRGVEIPESLAAMEQSALVARTILRARIPFPQARVTTAIERLRVSESLEDQLLALELGCAVRGARSIEPPTDDPKITRARVAADRQESEALDALLSRIVMRMTRAEAGVHRAAHT